MDPDPYRPAQHEHLSDALLGELGKWLLDRCGKAATSRPGLDMTDVYQQSVERLLRSSIALDPGNVGVHSYLGQCVDWVADDLYRQRLRHGGVDMSDDALGDRLDRGSATPPEVGRPDPSSDAELLAPVGLSPPQQAVMLNELGDGIPLVEFARLTSRSYSAVRKDRQRAVERLRAWLGLDPEETRALVAVRRLGSSAAAAEALRMSVADIRALHGRAQLKIDQKFDERSVGRHVP